MHIVPQVKLYCTVGENAKILRT